MRFLKPKILWIFSPVLQGERVLPERRADDPRFFRVISRSRNTIKIGVSGFGSKKTHPRAPPSSKKNHIHDKRVRELVFSNSGSWFLKLQELISETPGVVFWNSGSFTFSIRLVLRTTPGVALKELRELHWGAVWWFFSWRSWRTCERRRMRQWQPKRSTWMLWISTKNKWWKT